MLISEFYKNKELFITGGTGFLGKSLIEKLLRDCPDIAKIYLLVRSKQNKTPLERIQDFAKEPVFERLHRERPTAFNKIVAIVGDCNELGVGISAEDLERLKNVNIVIHGAANVRFDNVLRSSILMNSRGTYELLKLMVNFKKLIAFIHVSTAYVTPMEYYLKEEPVEPPVNWRTAIKIAETFEDKYLEVLRIKYTKYPNAYTFSKILSEQVVAEFADKLPITILRPSIVSPSLTEPEPGFVDNINGAMGLLLAIGVGISQITFCKPNLIMSFIPVDTVTNATVIAAYRRGLETLNSKTCGLDIRNITPGKLYEITLKRFTDQYLKHVRQQPFESTFWAPRAHMTTFYPIFLLSVLLINVPLSIIYDILLLLSGKKQMMMKLTRKYVNVTKSLTQFSQEFYDFEHASMWELFNLVPEKETEKYLNDFLLNRIEIGEICNIIRDGIKRHILKQPTKSTPSAKLRYKIIIALDNIVKALLFYFIFTLMRRMLHL